MLFKDFGFHEQLLEGLNAMGFEKPTPIQEQAIPEILKKHDLIGCAQTGTGKTAAFLLPVMHHILNSKREGVSALIIVPTRELAIQVDNNIEGLGYFTGISSCSIIGGGDGSIFETEKQAIKRGADFIVATPGRLISHINLGYVDFKGISHLILDEADRMLDMGFYNDIMRIVQLTNPERQTLMFSATMPQKIRELARKTLKDPVEISIAVSRTAEGVLQQAVPSYDEHKSNFIRHLLKERPVKSALIFAARKTTVSTLVRELKRMRLSVSGISSDLEQPERVEVLRSFKAGDIQILVATDVLSRGIDIENIELVINYDVPNDPEDYIHRVGRTARAATTGTAITLVNPKDMFSFSRIEQFLGKPVEKLEFPASLGKAPTWELDGKRRPSKPGSGSNGKKPFHKKPFKKSNPGRKGEPGQN